MITLEIIKDVDFYFYFINKEIIELESKYKWHYTRIKRTMIYFLYFDYRKSTKLIELRNEINEKKFILSLRYLKKKLPDEIIYEIYKFF